MDGSFNLFSIAVPGIYQILCKTTNKVYIGEASNLLDRFATHYTRFERGLHDNIEMQSDWNNYGKDDFLATILFCGSEWGDKEKRLTKEKELILEYEPNTIYNKHPQTPSNNASHRIVCEICGQRYDSINQACKNLGESETDIRRKLHNNYPGYKII